MSSNANNETKLNLVEKLLKIQNMAGVLQKNKQAFNYKYTPEEDIQAKVTAGMQKYKVMLIPSIVQGSLKVTPYTYEKIKTKKEDGKIVEYAVPVHEIIVSADVVYTWINADDPEDKIECGWVYVGQAEAADFASGASMTYGNRYYLIKALQLATSETDPDNYRSKQKEAENFEQLQLEKEEKAKLKVAIDKVVNFGKELTQKGFARETMIDIVSKYNNGNGNPKSIDSTETAEKILNELKEISTQSK